MESISIPLKNGESRTVIATILNPSWAVHRTIVTGVSKPRCWTVTHRPTSYAVVKHIRSLKDAKALLKELAALREKYGCEFTECACERQEDAP